MSAVIYLRRGMPANRDLEPTIFLSYRRRDSRGYAGRIADHLEHSLGPVFRDVDSIDSGAAWKTEIVGALNACRIVLALVGAEWYPLLAEARDREIDYLRFELHKARSLGRPVLPVLLPGAHLGSRGELGDLAWLCDVHYFRITDDQGRWSAELDDLAAVIRRRTGLPPSPQPQHLPFRQSSSGDQSPNIVSAGSVSINFGKRSDGKE